MAGKPPAEQGGPLSLCIAGEDDLADTLGRLKGKLVKGRKLHTQTFKGTQVPGNCHMLYVAASEQKRYRGLVRTVRGQAILTVSELPGFARTGGIVELTHAHGRIRFIINLGLARAAGLEISPRLLALAEVVDQE
ncbi:MAG: YfiR family protein [Hydrogenophilales bacterium]|nr:YfiR family protein [Hydrogenophilales bacterium]